MLLQQIMLTGWNAINSLSVTFNSHLLNDPCLPCTYVHTANSWEWRTRALRVCLYCAVWKGSSQQPWKAKQSFQAARASTTLWVTYHLQRSNFCPLPVGSQTQGFLLWTPVSGRLPCYFKLSASVALKLFFHPFHVQWHPFTLPHTMDTGILVPSVLIALLAKHRGIVISSTWTSKDGLSFYATLLKTVWWE